VNITIDDKHHYRVLLLVLNHLLSSTCVRKLITGFLVYIWQLNRIAGPHVAYVLLHIKNGLISVHYS